MVQVLAGVSDTLLGNINDQPGWRLILYMLLDIQKKTAEKGSNEIDEKPLAWQWVALNNELSEKDALRTPCDFNVNSQTL